MSEKQLKEDFKNKRIDFILAQFESLQAHIDTLISSSTMRIYSFLFLYAIGASIISIIIGREENLSFEVIMTFGCIIMFVIGMYMIVRQIQSSAQIAVYFRILNRIRKKFVGDSQEFSELFGPSLPTSDKEPKSITTFDPGFKLIEILNSITLSALVYIWTDELIPKLPLVWPNKQLPIIVTLIVTAIVFCLSFRQQNVFIKNKEEKELVNLEKRGKVE